MKHKAHTICFKVPTDALFIPEVKVNIREVWRKYKRRKKKNKSIIFEKKIIISRSMHSKKFQRKQAYRYETWAMIDVSYSYTKNEKNSCAYINIIKDTLR